MENLRLSIAKEAREIPRREWDELFSPDIIEGYDYYKTLDESNLPLFFTRYAVVSGVPFIYPRPYRRAVFQ